MVWIWNHYKVTANFAVKQAVKKAFCLLDFIPLVASSSSFVLASCMTTDEQYFFGGKFICQAAAPALTGLVTKTAAIPEAFQTRHVVSWF